MLDVLTEAFADDPLASWLFPDADERRRLQPDFFRPLLDHPAAETDLAGRDGVAVWLTLTAGQTLDGGAELGERLRALGEALAPRHPHHEPHLYLPCMGVVPERRGTGLGSAMLRHRLERADADGLPAYLEAGSARSRALYLRHGFADLGDPVQVADSPLVWPMWREANR